MKKILSLGLVLVLVGTLMLTGCSGSDSKTIKFGLLSPTSGDLAPYGQAVKNAAELAVTEINAAGGIDGKDIELIHYDNEGDATKSLTLFNKLVDVDKIDALVGPVISTTSLAVAPIAQEKGIPMITPTATNKDVTPDYDFVFRSCYIDPYQGSVMAKFASENLSAKTAAILTNVASDYSVGLAGAFKEKFTASGGTLTNEEGYTNDDKDFNAVLTKIKADAPDVIFVPDYFNAVGIIATTVRELGIESILLGGDGWDGIQDEYAVEAEGYFFGSHYSTTDEDPIVQDFIKAYKAEFEETPNALGALAYDATNVLANAFKVAGSTDADEIVAALKVTDQDAVCGHITFDKNGDTIKAISIITIKDGNLELETKVSE